MARPSKLSDEKWAEVIRLHAGGASAADLARRYKVHPSQITRRVSQPAKTVKAVASLVAEAEVAFDLLPVSQQGIARTLADNLKGIAHLGAKAAATGMKTADLLHTEALKQVQTAITSAAEAGRALAPEDLRGSAACLDVAGRAAQLGTTLINANKDAGKKDGEPTLEELVAGAKP